MDHQSSQLLATAEPASASPDVAAIPDPASYTPVPSLINVGGPSGFEFDENLPFRNQPPVINNVPGALALQQAFDSIEWVQQAGEPVAYAPHLRKKPHGHGLPCPFSC